VNRKTAQKGFALVPLLIVGGALVVVILVASGALKFSASISKTPSESNTTKPTTTATPEKQKIDLTETYTDTENTYSIKYPSGWKQEPLKGSTVIYSTDLEADSPSKAIAGIIIYSIPLSGSLVGAKWETQIEIMRLQLEKDYPTATFTDDSDVKVGSFDAHVYNYIYQNGSNDFRAKFFLIIKGERFYGLMTMAIQQRWEKYEPALSQIVQSFRTD